MTQKTLSFTTYGRLIRELTYCQLKARYRRTFAGFFWVLMSPVVMYTVQALVFRGILRVEVPDYAIFLLGGLLPWIFMVSSLEMGIPSLTSSRQLLVAFRVDPLVILGGSILDNWINFIAAFLLVLIPALLMGSGITVGLVFLPLAMLVLLTGVAGLVALLALLNVFYRDVRYVVHFLVWVLFFLTPIFYPREVLRSDFQWMVSANPLYHLAQVVRECIYAFSLERFLPALLNASMVAIGMIALALFYWKKRKNEFYHYL